MKSKILLTNFSFSRILRGRQRFLRAARTQQPRHRGQREGRERHAQLPGGPAQRQAAWRDEQQPRQLGRVRGVLAASAQGRYSVLS